MGSGDGYRPYYICHAIGMVLKTNVSYGLITDKEASTLKHNLCTGILAGISHTVTFGGFMVKACQSVKDVSERDPEEYINLLNTCRIAWLDWIIETGEIKPDFLAGDER